MYIIDRNQDYYDFYSHVYGVDKKVVFDRRESKRLDDKRLACLAEKYYNFLHKREWHFLLLEVGYVQHLIKLFDLKFKPGLWAREEFESCSFEIAETYRENRNLFGSPLSVRLIDLGGRHVRVGKGFKYLPLIPPLDEVAGMCSDRQIVDLPILAHTALTALLDPFEVWKDLSTYISSLDNDKDAGTNMTDVERATARGFDKFSFRHPIK